MKSIRYFLAIDPPFFQKLDRLREMSFKLPWFLLLIVVLLPIAAHMVSVPVFEEVRTAFPVLRVDNDVFAFVKLMALLPLASLALFHAALVVRSQDQLPPTRTRNWLLPAAFAICTLVATLNSEYSSTAWWGFPGHYQGGAAVLAYIALYLSASWWPWRDRQLEACAIAVLAGGLAIAGIGLLQYFDIWQLDEGWIRPWILGDIADDPKINLKFTHQGVISATLYNPNFIGSYGALIVPYSVSLYLAASDRRRRACLFAISCLIFALLVGSNSRGGLYGALVGFVAVGFWHRHDLRASALKAVTLGAMMLVIYSGMGMGLGLSGRTGGQSTSGEHTNMAVTAGIIYLRRGRRSIAFQP
ncbi:MAG: hypothetical protein O6703_11120, partial [Gammaproteobacteria bacterium]|nr:hypothetical protein [Gammaproteobacteria bacterium]